MMNKTIKVSPKRAKKNIKLGCSILEKALKTSDVKAMEVGLIAISNGLAVLHIQKIQEKEQRLIKESGRG